MSRVLAGAVAVILAIAASSAQTPTGAIGGRVAEKSGVPFRGVAITLDGSAMATPQTVVSDTGGAYQFTGLADGSYRLTFQLLGFCTMTDDDVVVERGGRVTKSISLADTAS